MKTTFNNPILFPGTFDPITNKHLAIAECVLRQTPFDTVVFMPAAPKNIRKREDITNFTQRLHMIELAIKERKPILEKIGKRLVVSDAFNKCDTPLQAIKAAYQQFYTPPSTGHIHSANKKPKSPKKAQETIPTLKGIDSYKDMTHWASSGKQSTDDLNNTFLLQHFYVFRRSNEDGYDRVIPHKFKINRSRKVKVKYTLINADNNFKEDETTNVSSTDVRNLINKTGNLNYLLNSHDTTDPYSLLPRFVPETVAEYIQKCHLYINNLKGQDIKKPLAAPALGRQLNRIA